MRFAVLGPGGVGGLLAGLLVRGGHDVVCLAREETAAALEGGGLTVRSATFGDFQVPVRAATVLDEPVDAVLVTVKATALEAACERVPAAVLGGALVVPFLNGVEHVAWLRDRYPEAQVLAATIRIETTRVAPGVIEHQSPFAVIELARHGDAARVDELGRVLAEVVPSTAVEDDETAVLWGKLLVLAPMALVTAAVGGPVGLARTERRDDMIGILEEIGAVMRALGVGADTALMARMIDSVPAGMRTSMERDAAAGRALELDAIGGSILHAAERTGVDVPVTTRLVEELRAR
jgi:2-dehydropantoate 2-reductase